MSAGRLLFAVALVAMVALLGWRVVASELDRRTPEAAEGPAVERLSRSPLDGDAFSDLAVASRDEAATSPEALLELHQVAARRDPRDLRVRAWLADHNLRARRYAEAMSELDVLLRLSPDFGKTLPPMIAVWAEDPGFAEALAGALRNRPAWSRSMIAALRGNIARPGAAGVLAALNATGDLDDAESARWLDALMRSGQWALARRHWLDGLGVAGGAEPPLVHNGGFEQAPSQRGFDWRTGRRSGSYVEFAPAPGAEGQAAHVVLLGRPVEFADLEQPLALGPGRYRLTMRARAAALRTDQGLRWTLECHGKSRPVASSDVLDGTFDWREVAMNIEIPDEGCPGQWLRLRNPAPRGSARMASGELWFDGVEVAPARR